jgi:hypothetical protein
MILKFLLYPLIYIGLSLYSLFSLLYLGELNYSFQPTLCKNPNQETIIRNMTTINFQDMNESTLLPFIENTEPVIIKSFPSDVFESLYKNDDPTLDFSKNMLYLKYIQPEPCLIKFLYNYTLQKISYILNIRGNYDKTFAHIDYFSCLNFYYLFQGKKLVTIIPEEYTKYLEIIKSNSMYIKDSQNDDTWLDNIPDYYKFELVRGDVLLFDTKLVHKFTNLVNNASAYSFRFKNEKKYSILSLHGTLFNWKVNRCVFGYLFNKNYMEVQSDRY